MRWLNRTSRSGIGIDVDGRSVKAAQLSRVGRGWRLDAAAIFPRQYPGTPLDGAEVKRVAEVLERQGFVGRDLVLSVPPERLMADALELPPRASGAPLEQIARAELARAHKADIQAFEMASWDLPAPARGGAGTHMMAVACLHTAADEFLGLFEAHGLSVRALDVQACALVRACSGVLIAPDDSPRDPRLPQESVPAKPPRQEDTAQPAAAILSLGWDAATLVVAHQGVVIFQRTMPEIGSKRVHSALAQQTGLHDEAVNHLIEQVGLDSQRNDRVRGQDLVAAARHHLTDYVRLLTDEARLSITYAGHRYPDVAVSTLWLTDDGAAIPGMADGVSAALELPAKTVCPQDVVECHATPPDTRGRPALMTALGLAMHEE